MGVGVMNVAKHLDVHD